MPSPKLKCFSRSLSLMSFSEDFKLMKLNGSYCEEFKCTSAGESASPCKVLLGSSSPSLLDSLPLMEISLCGLTLASDSAWTIRSGL